ncbi:hypothetical protein GCM10029976_038850 [Kribbella albertanoniae]|uniref:Uncharacterized protein n=1 Tax=Kribbella albertanoniae TaxID=1266829 RepID=A0A4R4PZQ2_9ACTN|nr:hypothetical protein [Kribbella albertanoniae]TDC28116.1 hypothetical protein E1261_19485 [Kribbella albertanoniae]
MRADAKKPGVYPFSVGAGQPVTGVFVASATSLTSKWPEALVKCAEATGKKLPEILKEGAKATWTLEQTEPLISVLPRAGLTGQVDKNKTARLPFVTGHENDDQGTQVIALARAKVKIERTDVSDLISEARKQVQAAFESLLSVIPDRDPETPLRPDAEPARGGDQGSGQRRLPDLRHRQGRRLLPPAETDSNPCPEADTDATEVSRPG